MKKIIFLLLSVGCLVAASIPSSGGGQSSVIGDTRAAVYVEPTLNSGGNVGAAKASNKASADAVKDAVSGGAIDSTEMFFEMSATSSCDSAEALKCPPLKAKYAGGSYVTMISYINPKEGQIGCTVYEQDGDLFEKREGDDLGVPIASQVITRQACVKKFSTSANLVNTQSVNTLREVAKNRQKQLDKIKAGYQNITPAGGKTYMDLGDWLDAMATVDGGRIDIQSSLSKGEIQTTSKWTNIPNAMVFTQFDENLRSLITKKNIALSSNEIDKIINDSRIVRDRNKNMANSQYIMFLGYFVAADKLIVSTLAGVLAIFAFYNILATWILPSIFQKANDMMLKKQSASKENHVHRFVAGLMMVIVFFSGTVEKYETKEFGEVEVKEQRIRDVVRWVYEKTNSMSDELTKIAITSYLRYITSTSGTAGVDKIDGYTTEKEILTKENELLLQIEASMCTGVYNTEKYKEVVMGNNKATESAKVVANEEEKNLLNILKELRKTNWDKDFTTGAELVINPFPKTEQIAFDNFSKLDPPLNPYSSEAGIFKGGNNFMSMSGCYNNKNRILENNTRLKEVDLTLAQIKEDFKNTDELDKIKNVYQIMWKNYSEFGYLSMVFLPATAVMVDEHTVLGDKTKRDEDNKLDENIGMTMAKMMATLSIFGGEDIYNMLKKTIVSPLYGLKETYENSVVGMVTEKAGVGGVLKSATTTVLDGGTYILTYKVINALLDSVVLVITVAGGILAFILLTLHKLWAFMAVIFVAIYAFAPNQEQKMIAVAGKIIVISFKTVLLTVSLFIVLFAVALMDSLESNLVNSFFLSMQGIKEVGDTYNPLTMIFNWVDTTFVNYVFYGVSSIVFIVAKVVMIITVIFKMPNFFFEILDSRAEDLGDKMMDTIQSVTEQRGTKGM